MHIKIFKYYSIAALLGIFVGIIGSLFMLLIKWTSNLLDNGLDYVKSIEGPAGLISAKLVVGREGPTIQISGSLGEMIGEWFKLSRRRTDSLVAAGAAAGLAVAFNPPLAGGMGALFASVVRESVTGIILVVEMTQNYSMILQLMVACLTSTTVVQLAGNQPIFTQLLRCKLISKVKNLVGA